MRTSPFFVLAGFLIWLAPAPAVGQHLDCAPCAHAFGKVQIGKSPSFLVHVTNTSTVPITILSKTKQNPVFSIRNFPLPVSLRPGESIPLTVVFTPKASGHTTGYFAFASTAENSPLTVTLQGTGVTTEPELTISPATLSFGKVPVGSSTTLQATITVANSPVSIASGESTSSEFVIMGMNMPAQLSPGQSLPVTIQFTPNASGYATGKAGFISDALNTPTVLHMNGSGVPSGAHGVTLSWDPGDGNAVGYNLYRGTSTAGPFSQVNAALNSSTNYTDSTVVAGTTYYYVATEVNSQGEESGYSNAAKAVIPNP